MGEDIPFACLCFCVAVKRGHSFADTMGFRRRASGGEMCTVLLYTTILPPLITIRELHI